MRRMRLDTLSADPPAAMTKDKARKAFDALGEELFELQDAMFGAKLNGVLVMLQGRDGAGKDGTIKHVVGCLNPRGVAVTSFGVPTEEERSHDFLWRVHRHAPRLGEFAIFNRSHYEDVLVVRVHGLVPRPLWQARYEHIAAFERLLAGHGTLILKFFLHITRKEQEERLLDRERDPQAAWKLNPKDWQERDHWDAYTEAYEEAIAKTSAPHARWTVVPANKKWYRNLVVAESIVKTLRAQRPRWDAKLAEMGKIGREAIQAYRNQKRGRRRPA